MIHALFERSAWAAGSEQFARRMSGESVGGRTAAAAGLQKSWKEARLGTVAAS
jgi:hypothetical protein